MDKKEIVDNFNSHSKNCIVFLEKLTGVTYASVLLYKKTKLLKVLSNNYNNWETIFFKNKHHFDCVLMEIAEKLTNIGKNEDTTIIWNSVPENIESKINKEREKHNIYHGISLIHGIDEEYAICIAASLRSSQA